MTLSHLPPGSEPVKIETGFLQSRNPIFRKVFYLEVILQHFIGIEKGIYESFTKKTEKLTHEGVIFCQQFNQLYLD
jgi:hypothetical protein